MIEPVLSDDAFLANLESASTDPGKLSLWWLGQSGFLAQWERVRVLFDPYLSDSLTRKYANTNKPHVRMSRRVVDPARLRRITLIAATHGHTDHLDADTLQAIRKADLAQSEPWGTGLVAPARIEKLVDERWGGRADIWMTDYDAKIFGSNDLVFHAVAASHGQESDPGTCLGYVVWLGGWVIYHSGDTVVYDGMVERLQKYSIDVALLPINGKLNNMNGREAAQLAKDIGAKLVIPCHYDMFEFNTADPREQFIPECKRLGQPYRVLKLGERLTLEARQSAEK